MDEFYDEENYPQQEDTEMTNTPSAPETER